MRMDSSCDGTERAVGRACTFYKAWDLNGFFGFRIMPIGMTCIGDGVVPNSTCTGLGKLSVFAG